MVGQQGGGDPQGEGESGAQRGDGGGGLGVGGHAGVVGAARLVDRAGQQVDGGVRGEGVQVVEAGADVQGVARGDKGGGAAVGGQQRLDLCSGGGVVENEEDAAAGSGQGIKGAAVEAGAVLEAGRGVLGRYAQGAEQAVQGALGGEPAVGVVAEQVDEEDPAWEPPLLAHRPDGGLYGQLGLADPGQPG